MRLERWFYTVPLRVRSLLRRTQVDQELQEEIRDHLELQVKENLARGMSPEEARTEALRALGGVAQIEEECREKRRVNYIENFLQDLRYGIRQLRRSPGTSLLAILCLVVGIGATAAVFSWIEGILLRPFPAVVHQERLVAVAGTKAAGDRGTLGLERTDLSSPDWLDFQRSCTLFDSFIISRIMGTTLSIGDRAEIVTGSVVSANYFEALGVRPILGRGFEPAEDFGRNAHPVTVISYWIWKERFRGDPGIVGRTQLLDGVPHTIVGVAPDGFYGTFVGYPVGFWVPASMQETFVPGGYQLEDRAGQWIEGYARLKPGVSIKQAQQEISAVAKRLESAYLSTNRGRGVALYPLSKTPFSQAGNLRPTLEITLAVVFLVLLIACANVSSLLLVRSLARRHEMTVRLAVGARRGRLVRQLLSEGLILSTLAAAGGLMVAYWCRNALAPIFTPGAGLRVNLNGEMDWRVFAFSASVCLLSTLLFGLVPAMQTSKVDLSGALKAESATALGSRGKSRVRSTLVLLQVALSFILVVGAVLLLQSLRRIRAADPGFSTDNVLTTSVDLVSAGYDAQRAKTFQDALIERVRALPGVESAALARARPFSYSPYYSAPIAVDGYHPAPDEQPEVVYNQVGPGYFATMGIPLVSGRDFSPADNEAAPLVAIVNEKMVAQYWHGEDPVGRRLQVKGQTMRVVGVAKLAKYSTFSEPPQPFFYVPARQNFTIRCGLNIRTSQDRATITAAVTREIRALDANLALSEVITMREHILRTALSSQQIAVTLLTIFGGLALLLAAVGLYGVMSYAVSQSGRELALRMALGARASDVLRLVLSHGLVLTAGGVAIGGVAALALTRLIANLLYKVNPRDPAAFGLAFLVMTTASLTACFLPAWRASRTDPVRAMRD
jgi:macrolide transport system ATP-binding/permease protein